VESPRIKLEEVLPILKSIPWNRYVKFAFLTGSLVERGSGRDVDVVISEVDLEAYSELLSLVVKSLGVSEDFVDLVQINEATPCSFVVYSFSHSIPLYVGDWDEVFRLFNICLDHQIDTRKLSTLEIAIAKLHED